jgi:hypothetical protein
LALACILVLGLHPGPAEAEQQSTGAAAGWGALSALTSLVYAPVKVAYAIGGLVVGGFAWVFSAGDNDVARTVTTPAVRGDYVVTPDHLRGKQPLEFIGRAPEPSYQAPEPSFQEPEPSFQEPEPEY